MLKWKSKGIQHRRLYCNEIIRTSIFAVFLIITTFLNAQTFSHKETTVSESFHKAETFYLLHQWEKAIPIYQEIECYLKKTYDIQRLHRKLLIQHNVKPYEFYLIHQTYSMLNNIITFIE